MHKGFTLIEILVVIGILAILAGIVIVAINPAKQFAQARNTQRQSNVTTILNAIGQRIVDNKGVFAGAFTIGGTTYTCPTLSTATSTISTTATSVSAPTIDLACLTPTYIPAQIPVDPAGGTWTGATNYDSKYTVKQDANGRVTVEAPNATAESSIPGSPTIAVTR